MKILTHSLVLMALLGATLPAGAADDPLKHRPAAPPDTGIAPPTRIPTAETVSTLPQGSPVATAAIPRAVRRAVVADAARRFNVAESEVVLTRAEQVTWSDGALGCAQPGGIYTQRLVPGYLVMAKSAGGELAYHTDARAHAVSCGSGRPIPGNKLSDRNPVRGSQPVMQPPTPER